MVSVYFVPYLGQWLLKTKPKVGADEDLYDTPFYTRFKALVNWCVQHRWITIGLTILALVAGFMGMSRVQQQFFPDSSRLELLVDLWLPEGTSFQTTEDVAKRFEARLMKEPGVQTVTTWVGSGLPRASICQWIRSSRKATSVRRLCCRWMRQPVRLCGTSCPKSWPPNSLKCAAVPSCCPTARQCLTPCSSE